MSETESAPIPAQLHRYALDCLARREHSRSELQRKLRARCAQGGTVESLLNALQNGGQLDEGRYAEAFLHARMKRGQGPLRIRRELEQRGVAKDCIDAALEAAECDWTERALEVRRKKFGAAPPQNLKDRLRQMRYLEYRGFARDMISAAFPED